MQDVLPGRDGRPVADAIPRKKGDRAVPMLPTSISTMANGTGITSPTTTTTGLSRCVLANGQRRHLFPEKPLSGVLELPAEQTRQPLRPAV